MRIGVTVGGTSTRLTVSDLANQAKDFEARGFSTIWIPNVFGLDAVTTSALLGRETHQVEIGTAVVPTVPRHPVALAQQALSAAAASRGRFTLGIGLSHPAVIEGMFGLSIAHPARQMQEYMNVLGPLLQGEPAHWEGEVYCVHAALDAVHDRPVPVVIAALGARMLKIAGQLAAGTILWMTGPRTIEHHIGPKIRSAASEAGQPDPRIVAGMHIVLTSNMAAAQERVAKRLAIYSQMPSYRAMIEKEGGADVADLALVGDEKVLAAGLQRLRDVGVSDFQASVMRVEEGSDIRTLEFLETEL